MSNELLTILEYIEQERGISRESTIRALESAILSASRKSIHPASELKIKIDPPADAPHEAGLLALDCSKAKKELNWAPVVDIDEGLNSTIKYFKACLKG